MQVSWFERLLADRGVHGNVIEARLVSKGSELMLDVRTSKTNAQGKPLVIFDVGGHRVAEERHVIPIGGMVLDLQPPTSYIVGDHGPELFTS